MTPFHAAALVSVTPKISAAPPSVMAIGDRYTNCWNGKEPETPILMGVEDLDGVFLVFFLRKPGKIKKGTHV